jgi:hypothetical protein
LEGVKNPTVLDIPAVVPAISALFRLAGCRIEHGLRGGFLSGDELKAIKPNKEYSHYEVDALIAIDK